MTLYLLPNVLGLVEDYRDFLPKSVDAAIETLDGLIAESEGEGRRYLKRFKTKKPPYQMPIALLSEDINFLLEPLLKGENWGVVSDAGLPCLADPGSLVVRRAKQLSIPVKALSGPSSIFLALMQSGLSGQQFIFHGYIPKKPEDRQKALTSWSKNKEYTHIFIEAPYRNIHTFEACLENLHDNVLLCVATDLTLSDEWIRTERVSNWKKDKVFALDKIAKKPSIFLFSN